MNNEKVLIKLDKIFDEQTFLSKFRNKDFKKMPKNCQDRGRSFIPEQGLSAEIVCNEFVRHYVRPEVESYVISKIYKFALENLNVFKFEEIYKFPNFNFAFICILNSNENIDNYIKFKKTELIVLPENRMFSSFEFKSDEDGGFEISKNAVPIKALILHRESIEVVIEQFLKIIKSDVSYDNKTRYLYRIMYDVFVNEEYKNLIYAVI